MRASEESIEQFCEAFHDAYERAAEQTGWQTQPRSRVLPWQYVPAESKAAMRIAAREVLARHDADVIEWCAGMVKRCAEYGEDPTDLLLQVAKGVRVAERE